MNKSIGILGFPCLTINILKPFIDIEDGKVKFTLNTHFGEVMKGEIDQMFTAQSEQNEGEILSLKIRTSHLELFNEFKRLVYVHKKEVDLNFDLIRVKSRDENSLTLHMNGSNEELTLTLPSLH